MRRAQARGGSRLFYYVVAASIRTSTQHPVGTVRAAAPHRRREWPRAGPGTSRTKPRADLGRVRGGCCNAGWLGPHEPPPAIGAAAREGSGAAGPAFRTGSEGRPWRSGFSICGGTRSKKAGCPCPSWAFARCSRARLRPRERSRRRRPWARRRSRASGRAPIRRPTRRRPGASRSGGLRSAGRRL